MLLGLSVKKLAQTTEAENTNATRSKAWFANPDIVSTIDLAVLGILFLQLFVHSVRLVHHVDVGDLPATEPQHIVVVGEDQFTLLFQHRHRICLLLELLGDHRHVKLSILHNYVQNALVE